MAEMFLLVGSWTPGADQKGQEEEERKKKGAAAAAAEEERNKKATIERQRKEEEATKSNDAKKKAEVEVQFLLASDFPCLTIWTGRSVEISSLQFTRCILDDECRSPSLNACISLE